MDATTSRELEELFAGLGAREQREVLEYAKALKDGSLDEDSDQVHLMGSISRKDLRLVKESLEDEGVIGVLVLRFLGAFSVHDDEEDGDEQDGDEAARQGEEDAEDTEDEDEGDGVEEDGDEEAAAVAA
jgi:hypothetical protein